MTGGGTGGHIYPAIAIADKIKEENETAEIIFVGTERGLEKTIVPASGYPIQFIQVRGFDRKNLLKNIEIVMELFRAFKASKKIIDEFKPDMVIGTGGYVCGPVVRSAYKSGVRTYIHEQNAVPGLTNRLLEKYVSKIFLGFEEAGKNFNCKEKIVFTGNPVRKEFKNLNKEVCREKLGIPKNNFVILAFGGSGGAGMLNKEMVNLIKNFQGLSDVSIFFGTGKVYYEKVLRELEAEGIIISDQLKVLEYIENMHFYLGGADLVISRSGALTVAEITFCGKASVLIPSPNVTGNHQYFNAKAVSEKGGAILIEEKDLDENKVVRVVRELMENRCELEAMEVASRNWGQDNATEIIYRTITSNFK